MTKPTGGFIWYELMTTNPDGAAAFYGPIVGWTIVGEPDPAAPVEYRHILRSDGGSGGGVLKLTEQMCANGGRPIWAGYLHVADIDAALDAIRADGGSVLMPKTTIDVGSFALVADPQGVPHYVMTPVPPADNPHAESDVYDRFAPERFAWNELLSPDLEAARAFYAKHYNFEFNSSMPMGPMGDYCFIDHGGETIGAIMQKPAEVPVGLWNFYIRVADIDNAARQVKELGGQVLQGPMEVPGGDWVLNGIDPQGAAFSLVAAKGQ